MALFCRKWVYILSVSLTGWLCFVVHGFNILSVSLAGLALFLSTWVYYFVSQPSRAGFVS